MQVYEAWYEMAPACPQLYLYSSADPIVPAQDVERYMKIQVRLNPPPPSSSCLDRTTCLLCAFHMLSFHVLRLPAV
jgi:hypothetical protein